MARTEIKPDKSKAPGAKGLEDVVNGFAWYALIAAAGGFLIGGACWAIGGRIGNDYTATGGKVVTVEDDRPGRLGTQSGQRAQQARLAAPRRTQHSHHLARVCVSQARGDRQTGDVTSCVTIR